MSEPKSTEFFTEQDFFRAIEMLKIESPTKRLEIVGSLKKKMIAFKKSKYDEGLFWEYEKACNEAMERLQPVFHHYCDRLQIPRTQEALHAWSVEHNRRQKKSKNHNEET